MKTYLIIVMCLSLYACAMWETTIHPAAQQKRQEIGQKMDARIDEKQAARASARATPAAPSAKPAAATMSAAPATSSAAPSAVLTFEEVTHYTNDTVIPPEIPVSYNLYQGEKGADKSLAGPISNGATVTTGLQAGKEYCWEVTSVAGGSESTRSNEACKNFPPAEPVVPKTVTITVM